MQLPQRHALGDLHGRRFVLMLRERGGDLRRRIHETYIYFWQPSNI